MKRSFLDTVRRRIMMMGVGEMPFEAWPLRAFAGAPGEISTAPRAAPLRPALNLVFFLFHFSEGSIIMMSRFYSKACMRTRAVLLLAAALLLGAGSAWAGGASAILGDWAMKMDYQGNLIDAKLNFTEKDGKLAGKWSSQRGDNELTNIKFEGNKVTFTRTIKLQDQTFDLEYEGVIEGDKITGKYTTPMGDMTANGVRQSGAPAAEPAAAPAGDAKAGLAGVWDLTVDSQLGSNKRKLTINPDNTGTYEADYGKFDIKNLKTDGNKVCYDLTVKLNDQSLDFKFEGTVDGKTLKGVMKSDMGDATVAGTKAGEAAGAAPAAPAAEILSGPVNLEGNWKMTIQTPDGAVNEGLLTVVSKGGNTSATLTTDLGDVKIKKVDLDGNKLAFGAEVDFCCVMVPVSFKGSTGADKLKGIVNLTYEGQ
ncbi:hypothetical protein HYR69_05890, partial [Candidatus Sumerlaeota bacterium]|nr:hypothetical protein [Candidatus Sumerlaeota bacterium]